MSEDIKFYHVDTDYIKYLDKDQKHIWENEEKSKKRPYIGIVINIGDFKYYAPLTSPKRKHENWKDSLDFIRIDYKNELKAAININNIIPVSDENITLVDVDLIKSVDIDYYNLLLAETIVIRKKQDKIRKNAKIIYNIVTKNKESNEKLIKRCYDFKLLEQKCKEFNAK